MFILIVSHGRIRRCQKWEGRKKRRRIEGSKLEYSFGKDFRAHPIQSNPIIIIIKCMWRLKTNANEGLHVFRGQCGHRSNPWIIFKIYNNKREEIIIIEIIRNKIQRSNVSCAGPIYGRRLVLLQNEMKERNEKIQCFECQWHNDH